LKSLLQLIKWEFTIQNKINNLVKYLLVFLIFTALSMVLVSKRENINEFGVLLLVIYIPLSLISSVNIILKQDVADGSLELLLSTVTPLIIVITKFIVLLTSSVISCVLAIPVIAIMFNLTFAMLSKLIIVLSLLLIITSALSVLIAVMQSYFKSNTNFLSVLIMPLIMPSVIMTGLVLNNDNNFHLIFVMLGINLIMIPCVVLLASHLIKNIYNI
jgi:heme exporter protein B